MQTLAELDDNEDEIFLFLKKIDTELSRILDDDIEDVVKLFSTLPASLTTQDNI